jgi:hypothetical protein
MREIIAWLLLGFSTAVNAWLIWRLRLTTKELDDMGLYYLCERLGSRETMKEQATFDGYIGGPAVWPLDTVWVVTMTSFECPEIVGVYDDKALAEMVAAEVKGEVCAYNLNPDEANWKGGLRVFCVYRPRNGDAETGRGFYYLGNDRWVKRNAVGSWALETWTWARDEADAVEIANKRRAWLLAHMLWPGDDMRRPPFPDVPWIQKDGGK